MTTPPNRGTAGAWPIDGGFAFLCDCGTTTEVDVEIMPGAPDFTGAEISVICDGCDSVHWLTITTTAGAPDA